MTIDDKSHTLCDQNAQETTPLAITHANLGKSHGIDETLTVCTNPSAEEEIACKEMLSQQQQQQQQQQQPALAQRITINNENDEGKHSEPAFTTQTTNRANADSSVDEEQSHGKCAIPLTQEDVSSKETRAKPRLVSDSTVVSDNLSTKPVAARISDDDLMNVLEHCFDNVDFASISLNENSEGYNEDDIKTLKKIFGSNADDTNNHNRKKGSNVSNIMNKTSNQKYFKSHHLRKRRFFKHLIENNNIRVRLERMLQKSASADLFISKTKQKRKRNTQQQSSKHVAAAATATTATKLFDDQSAAKEVSEGYFQSNGNEDGKAGASDKNDRRSDGSNITNENDTNGDKCDLTHLKKANYREEVHNTPHTSNNSEMDNHPFSDRIQDKNVISPNQEGSSSCLPLEENGVSECTFHVDDLKVKEEGESDVRTSNAEPIAALSCVNEKGYSRRRKNSLVDDEVSNERRNDGPVDLDAMYDQEEFAALLSSHQDPHARNEIDPERTTTCSMKEQANTTTEKYTDARQLWAARAVGNESDSDCSERNGDEIDSKSSGIGSFETASPFFFGVAEEKGPKTKLTSVTMEDDSMKTCYSSREVSLGGPLSEEEGLNLMQSSISRLVKARGEKSREQRIRFTCMVVNLLLATIGIFALGVFLGLMSHSKWNSYQEQKGELEPP